MRPGRRAALETLLPMCAIGGVSHVENPERALLPRAALAEDGMDCWLEIGFGSGDHLLATARSRPDVVMLGAEPYREGVAALLRALGPDGPQNLRIHAGDGRDLLDVLPAGTIGRAFLLYPDPWPKRRHARRRFVCRENLDSLARTMRPGAELRMATDIAGYVRHSLAVLLGHPAFAWTARGPQDWREPWPEWNGTRYERKARAEGRRPVYLTFRREG